ncbi:hypothetical protein J7L05_03040 [bacterium]|nr:hypothetical protein [bacterium]
MNDNGKLNLGLILIGLISLTIISLGIFTVASRAQDGAIPKAPILQADPDTPPESPPGDEPVDITDTSEQADDNEEGNIPPPADVEETEETYISHRDSTPRELTELGIYYKDDEGSPVAERTKLINNVNLPSAMMRKNDQARSFQTMNTEGRFDPLFVTDMIPEGLRPELEGEGISGAVDSGLIDQLIQTKISTFFKYLPIQIIGTMQNGPYKSALISIRTLGYYKILKEGQGDRIVAFGGDEGYYVVGMTVTKISEDHVTINISATLIDYIYNRALSTTPTVTRHFYVRRYN